jgi:hypothetical protein
MLQGILNGNNGLRREAKGDFTKGNFSRGVI